MESSSWPISSFLVLVNFHAGGTWVPLLEPPEYGHPGEYGSSFYYEQLQWNGTMEAFKAMPGAAPFWPLPGYSSLDDVKALDRLRLRSREMEGAGPAAELAGVAVLYSYLHCRGGGDNDHTPLGAYSRP